MDKKRLYMLLGDLAVLIVAFIWGATNVVIRDTLSGITPFWFCALRFIFAFATVTLLFGKRAALLPKRIWAVGSVIGAIFISAYLVGAVALLYTTAGNQSFIISMSVVFVPLLVWFFTKKFPGWYVMAAVFLCTAGMAGLMIDESFSVNIGDALCFVSMMCVTAYVLLVQKFVGETDPYGFACWQSFGGMVAALATALIFEPMPRTLATPVWIAIIYAATIGFALTLVLQTVAQKYTTATHTAILLSTSSIFGSLLGVIFLDEPMTWRVFTSSALILLGVLTVEALPAFLNKQKKNITTA